MTYINCDRNVYSKQIIISYICKNTLKHINKNNWILYGKYDLKLVSFPVSPVAVFKLKMFHPSPLELLVPAVVRGHTQDRYRGHDFCIKEGCS